MLIDNKTHPIYKFITRWFFSTNHKCGALASLIYGALILYFREYYLYRKAVTVKPSDIHLKYSRGMKRSIRVYSFLSIGKRTLIMISPIRGAGNIIGNLIINLWSHLSTLFCGEKGLLMSTVSSVYSRFYTLISQSLGDTYNRNLGSLKYGYNVGFACSGIQLGRFRTLNSLRNCEKNVELPHNMRRDFSTSRESFRFKKLEKHKGKVFNIIEVIADVDFLQSVYHRIKFNLGVMTKGSDDKTLDSLTEDWFVKTSERLLNGSYNFKPARRVMIPKPNKSGLRPLTISNSKDKIVQQAMKIVLEMIYENQFLDTSHGFRPSRGCHSALEQIRMNWSGISWFLEFDVDKCFDNIDRHRLVNILKEDISDQRFIDLIFKLFNAGVIGWREGGPDPSEGISEGSVLSPILCNIYLHKLDLEVNRITEEYQKGKKRRVIPDVFNAERRVYRNKKFKMLSLQRRVEIMSKHRSHRRKLGKTMTDWNDPNFVRVRYVRYADDFLLGIAGTKEMVMEIRDRLITFVKSDLKLTLTGGSITHIAAGKVDFLGVVISAVPHSKFPKRFGKTLEKKKRVKNRIKLQKQVREERLLKTVRTALKKSLKGNSNVKNSNEFNGKIKVLKELVAQDDEFSTEYIKNYREFIIALSKTIIFVPDKLKETLATLEQEIYNWEKDLNVSKGNPTQIYKQLVGRYDALPPQINAPLKEIRNKLKDRGIISNSNKPKAIGRLIHTQDNEIIAWYNSVGRGLLNYYCCCQNFYKVKSYVDYMLRWSAIHTLAGKHKSSCRKIIQKYTKNLIIKDDDGNIIAQFISTLEIKRMGRRFRTDVSRDAVDKVMNQIWTKFTRTKFFGVECAVEGCENRDIEMHHISKLERMMDHFGNISVVTRKGRRVTGTEAFKVAVNRKQIPLCKAHHTDLHNGHISFQDISWEYIREII